MTAENKPVEPRMSPGDQAPPGTPGAGENYLSPMRRQRVCAWRAVRALRRNWQSHRRRRRRLVRGAFVTYAARARGTEA